LLGVVAATAPSNVIVNGGEPLEHPAFAPLVRGLARMGRCVEVETAGTRVPSAPRRADRAPQRAGSLVQVRGG